MDNLACPFLGAPVIEPAGSEPNKTVIGCVSLSVAVTVLTMWMHIFKAFDGETLGRFDRTNLCIFAQIISEQIHNHQIFADIFSLFARDCLSSSSIIGSAWRGRVPLMGLVIRWILPFVL